MNMSKNIVFEGWLTKSPPSRRIWRTKWRRRWFALRQSGELPGQYFLDYYADRNYRRFKGTINLDLCEQVDARLHMERTGNGSLDPNLRGSVFTIKTQSRTYHLEADCEAEMEKWVDAICRVCGLRATDETEELGSYQNSINIASTPVELSERADSTGPYIPISECITGVRAQGSQRAFTFDPKNIVTSTRSPLERMAGNREKMYTSQPQIRHNQQDSEIESSDEECKSLNSTSQPNIRDYTIAKSFTKLAINNNQNIPEIELERDMNERLIRERKSAERITVEVERHHERSERNIPERRASERRVQIVERHASDMHALDRHASERHALERHASERHALERHASERHAAERHAAEMHALDSHAPERRASVRYAPDTHVTEKRVPDRRASERRSSERRPAEKRPSERRSSERRSSERRSSERRSSERRSSERRSTERRSTERGSSANVTPIDEIFGEGPPVPPRPPKTFAISRKELGLYHGPKMREPLDTCDSIYGLRAPRRTGSRQSAATARHHLFPNVVKLQPDEDFQPSLHYYNMASLPPVVDRALKPRPTSHNVGLAAIMPIASTSTALNAIKPDTLQYLDLDLVPKHSPTKISNGKKVSIKHGKSKSDVESAYKTVDFVKTEAFNITCKDAEALRSMN